MARILVIEDDQAIRDLISKYLRHVSYDVLTAANGLEGVEAFRSCPDHIDLVLTDMRMPIMTGPEVVNEIIKTRPDVRVICMTGASEDVRLRDLPLMTKPFGLQDLGHRISHILADENSLQALGRRDRL
jgi:two-component system cell cycle sensor histidine kinase/response regulator CckA